MKNILKILVISLLSVFSLSLFVSAQTSTSSTSGASSLDDTSSSTSDSSSTASPTPDYQKVLQVTLKENTEWDGGAPISNVDDFDYSPIQFDLKPTHAATFFRPGESVNAIVYTPEKNFVGTDEIDWSWLANGNKVSGKIYINVVSSKTSSVSKSSVSPSPLATSSSSVSSSSVSSVSSASSTGSSSAVTSAVSSSSGMISKDKSVGYKVGKLILIFFAVLIVVTSTVIAIKFSKKK